MDTFLTDHETAIRLAAFLGAFALFSTLEAVFPRRPRRLARLTRWRTNGAMVALSTGLVALLALAAPLLAGVAAASFAQGAGWGLFNLVSLPGWAVVALSIIALDFAIWGQHVLTHRVPWLWRLHRVHHCDADLDASSALRFHPLEIAFSAAFKLAVILALGPPIVAVIAFEVLLNACALFNHANLRLPRPVDAALRTVIVTPDMHRVHHSTLRAEHNSNFGFCLSLWDRLFGTYRAAPQAGQLAMHIGLDGRVGEHSERLGKSLLVPLD